MSDLTSLPKPLSAKSNPNLFGHIEATKTLFHSMKSNQISHAWLISGPKGIGKATLAFHFSRFLLHPQAKNDSTGSFWVSPNETVFSMISSNSHSNLLVLEKQVDDKGKLTNKISNFSGVWGGSTGTGSGHNQESRRCARRV